MRVWCPIKEQMIDTSPLAALVGSLESAFARGEEAVVDSILSTRAPDDCEAALREIASLAIQTKRWLIARGALGRMAQRDVACELQYNISRNLVALQQYRPAVYAAVMAAPNDPRMSIVASATGLPTIHFTDRPGHATSYSVNDNPQQGASAMFARLKTEIAGGIPIALCGMGDGYLINTLALKPPALFLTMQHPVHIIEPKAQVVMLNLMVHDYTADNGPIQQPRFRWFVGPDWQQAYESEVLDELLTPLPETMINQGTDAPRISAGLQMVQSKLSAADLARKAEVEAFYANVPDEHWIKAFGSFPDRQPRVLMITTRFSTVVQYSTKDAAQAFGQLGWEAATVIEPSDWQRCSGAYIRKMLADFKPDFVFQIDHLRHEHGGLFPPQLPFACWIQDHLPNLCKATAGANVTMRDFVLSGMGSLFVQQHGYPRRQIVDLPQLSRVPMRPTEWTSDGDDIVYVSNWSKPAGAVVNELLAKYSNPPALKSLIELTCGKIMDCYAAGQTVSTYYDVRQILLECERTMGINISSPPAKDQVVNALFDRLNNTLYRHQSLLWTAELAKSMGLQLALYGRGWENHPALAPYARGSVKAGEELELLTRRSKINLQLEPHACFSHARLLSGLFAGGFFLIRDNPFNHLTQDLLNFVDRHLDSSICNVVQARQAIKEQHREALEATLARCACLSEQVDPIGMVRDWQRGGTLIPQSVSLPRLADVLFDSRASLETSIKRFINNPQLRYDISSEQRQNTQSRLSYKAGLDRATRTIARLLATEPNPGQARAA